MRQELARAHYQVTPLNRALVVKLMRQEFDQAQSNCFVYRNILLYRFVSSI